MLGKQWVIRKTPVCIRPNRLYSLTNLTVKCDGIEKKTRFDRLVGQRLPVRETSVQTSCSSQKSIAFFTTFVSEKKSSQFLHLYFEVRDESLSLSFLPLELPSFTQQHLLVWRKMRMRKATKEFPFIPVHASRAAFLFPFKRWQKKTAKMTEISIITLTHKLIDMLPVHILRGRSDETAKVDTKTFLFCP